MKVGCRRLCCTIRRLMLDQPNFALRSVLVLFRWDPTYFALQLSCCNPSDPISGVRGPSKPGKTQLPWDGSFDSFDLRPRWLGTSGSRRQDPKSLLAPPLSTFGQFGCLDTCTRPARSQLFTLFFTRFWALPSASSRVILLLPCKAKITLEMSIVCLFEGYFRRVSKTNLANWERPGR